VKSSSLPHAASFDANSISNGAASSYDVAFQSFLLRAELQALRSVLLLTRRPLVTLRRCPITSGGEMKNPLDSLWGTVISGLVLTLVLYNVIKFALQ
jgi:hypothetical protein